MPEQCTILHIEDTDADHVLFKRDLDRLQFRGKYIRANSFDAAKKMLQETKTDSDSKPDLIVADSKLGIYSGLDIVQWVKGHPELREVPVVVYSTAISPAQSRAALSAGAAACLTKPIDSTETLVALEIILTHVKQQCRARDEDARGSTPSRRDDENRTPA